MRHEQGSRETNFVMQDFFLFAHVPVKFLRECLKWLLFPSKKDLIIYILREHFLQLSHVGIYT